MEYKFRIDAEVLPVFTKIMVDIVCAKGRRADPSYTRSMARKEVGRDGFKYLLNKIEENVANGADRAAQMEHLRTRYVRPFLTLINTTPPRKLRRKETRL